MGVEETHEKERITAKFLRIVDKFLADARVLMNIMEAAGEYISLSGWNELLDDIATLYDAVEDAYYVVLEQQGGAGDDGEMTIEVR